MFYTIISFLATSLGPVTLAAHQVMMGLYILCTTWGEPLAQTAQCFMPAHICGVDRNLQKARDLLKSLMKIGIIVGFTPGCCAISVPWFFSSNLYKRPWYYRSDAFSVCSFPFQLDDYSTYTLSGGHFAGCQRPACKDASSFGLQGC